MKTDRFQMRVDPDALRGAQLYAKRTGTTVSKLVHEYLRELAAAHELMTLGGDDASNGTEED